MPFDPEEAVWGGALVGLLASSADVDEQGRFGSPVAPTQKRLLPFQQQMPPGTMGGSMDAVWGSVQSVRESVGRAPLAPVSGNVGEGEVQVVRAALGKEVSALERRVDTLSKRVQAQDSLIRGFCKLEIVRAGK